MARALWPGSSLVAETVSVPLCMKENKRMYSGGGSMKSSGTVMILVFLLVAPLQSNTQAQCYSTIDCSGIPISTSVEGCCQDSAMGLTYEPPGGGVTCIRCFVYGWIRQDEDGNFIAQETITRDEGETVNLTIGYQKGAMFATSPRVFIVTTSGSAEISDYQLVSSVSQTLLTDPIPFTVQLLNDGVAAEEEKTLTLTLTEQLNPDISENEFILETVDIRIRDINIQTGFNYSNITMEEGEEIEIYLNTIGMPRGTISIAVGVELATADERDYSLVERQFTISNIDLQPSITFEAEDDDVALEGKEKLFLTLSGSDVAVITNGRLEINIIDNDIMTFSFPEDDASLREDAGFFTLFVARDLETAKPVTLVATPVEYSVVNGTSIGEMLPSVPEYDSFNPPTATASLDFNDSKVVFTVPPGDEDFPIEVEIFEDQIYERLEEVFALLLSFSDESPTGAEINPLRNATLITIRDNDQDPIIDFEQKNYTLAEADSNVVYNLTITRNTPAEVTYSIIIREVAGGTADAGDYSVPTDVFLFRPEDDSITIPITITGDDQVELTEDFLIEIGQEPSSSVFVLPAEPVYRIFIEDDDGGVQVGFAPASYIVLEGNQVNLTIVKTGVANMSFTVMLSTAGGTATAGDDYTAVSQQFTFKPGTGSPLESVRTVTIDVSGDSVYEKSETFTLTINTDDQNVTLHPDTASVTILDNTSVKVGFVPTSYSVLEGTQVSLTIVKTGAADMPVTVTLSTAGGTATAGVDYEEVVAVPVVFSPGVSVQTVTLRTFPDEEAEGSETLIATITSTQSGVVTAPSLATITIEEVEKEGDSFPLAAIGTLVLVVVALVAIVTATVIGIVYYKKRKQRRTSVKQVFEQEYEEIPLDSRETVHAKQQEDYEVIKESIEYADVGSSSQLASIKMKKNVVYGNQQTTPSEGVKGGEYEVIRPQALSAAPQLMAVNVAYGVIGQKM